MSKIDREQFDVLVAGFTPEQIKDLAFKGYEVAQQVQERIDDGITNFPKFGNTYRGSLQVMSIVLGNDAVYGRDPDE